MTVTLLSVEVPKESVARTVSVVLPSGATEVFQVAENESAAGTTSAPMPAGGATSSIREMVAPGACAVAEATTGTVVPRTVEPAPGTEKVMRGPRLDTVMVMLFAAGLPDSSETSARSSSGPSTSAETSSTAVRTPSRPSLLKTGAIATSEGGAVNLSVFTFTLSEACTSTCVLPATPAPGFGLTKTRTGGSVSTGPLPQVAAGTWPGQNR